VVCVSQQTRRIESQTAHPIFIDLPDNLLKISLDWIEFTYMVPETAACPVCSFQGWGRNPESSVDAVLAGV
jgi:hypothetical protein